MLHICLKNIMNLIRGENANRIFIFIFSISKVPFLIRIWILGGIILINYWEIRTFSKIKVPIGTKKLELVPIKTCPKIKDPCRHSGENIRSDILEIMRWSDRPWDLRYLISHLLVLRFWVLLPDILKNKHDFRVAFAIGN